MPCALGLPWAARLTPVPQRALWAHPPHRRASGAGPPAAAAPGARKPGRRARAAGSARRSGPAMQSLELGLVPAPAREPRLTRWLRRGSGVLAHLLALGFTIFLTVLSRPGTSECGAGAGPRGWRGGAGRGAGPRGWRGCAWERPPRRETRSGDHCGGMDWGGAVGAGGQSSGCWGAEADDGSQLPSSS